MRCYEILVALLVCRAVEKFEMLIPPAPGERISCWIASKLGFLVSSFIKDHRAPLSLHEVSNAMSLISSPAAASWSKT